MNQTILLQNLELYQKTDPQLAIQLASMDYFPIEENLSKNAVEKWFKTLPMEKVNALFVYGLESEVFCEVVKDWLHSDKKNFLIVLEDDLRIIHHFMQKESAKEFLIDPQTSLYFLQKPNDPNVIQSLSWSFSQKGYLIESLPHRGNSIFKSLREFLSYNLEKKNAVADEYLHYGIPFFRNFYRNVFQLPDAFNGCGLFGKFKNSPAIICGAGPSLEKQISLLKQYSNRFLLFGGSSSLTALKHHEITPHFGCGIDPNMLQKERLKEISETLPFFYRNRFNSEALKLIKGPKLYLRGSGGYEISEWFEEQLGIEGEVLEEGNNVVNFLIEIAYALGCSPIILIGVDLAYTDQKAYAKGIIDEISVKENFQDSVIREDIYGNPVQTSWKWIIESEWISLFQEKHPDVQLLNATEGGIGFKNVPNRPLKDVLETLQPLSQENAKIHEEIKKNKLNISKEMVIDAISAMDESLKRVISLCESIMKEIEKLKKSSSVTLMTGKAALYETELIEEPAYLYILDTFNIIYTELLSSQFHQIKLLNLSPHEIRNSQLELNQKRFKFLHETALINQKLLSSNLPNGTNI